MVDFCPSCGSVLAPEVHVNGPIKKAIIYYITRHPQCSATDIANYAYADDPNGGPDSGTQSIRVMIAQINRRIANKNLYIGRKEGRTGYSLLKIKEEQ